MATSKDPIVSMTVNESRDGYIVTHCSGQTYTLPCISCGNGGEEIPPGLPDNGKTRCVKIGLMTKVLRDQFEALTNVNSVGGWMGQDPQLPANAVAALTAWMFSWQVPIKYFTKLRDWMLSETNHNEWYNAYDGSFLVGGYTCLGNFIECCLPQDETLSDAFFNCLYANFDDPQLPCTEEDFQGHSALRLLVGYMQAFGNEYWREQFFIAASSGSNTEHVNCASFDPCETVGCPPDAVYSEYRIDWQGYSVPDTDHDFVWDLGGNPAHYSHPHCYGGGAYDPCTGGYNAREGVNFFLSTPLGCLKGFKFSYAGNGATNSTKARFYVNEVPVIAKEGIVGRTKCENPGGITPFSCTHVFVEPIQDVVSVRVEFYDLSGSNPAAGLDLHCLWLNMSLVD